MEEEKRARTLGPFNSHSYPAAVNVGLSMDQQTTNICVIYLARIKEKKKKSQYYLHPSIFESAFVWLLFTANSLF